MCDNCNNDQQLHNEICNQGQYESIKQAESLNLQGYRHAAHCMFYAEWNATLSDLSKPKAAVFMQSRSDGTIGFPGGMVSAGEAIVAGLNREICEEVGLNQTSKYAVTDLDYLFSNVVHGKKLVLHFYAKQVTLEEFIDIEHQAVNAPDFGDEVFGNIRVPLYILKDGFLGLPAFLTHCFIGNAWQQLLLGLVAKKILSSEEVLNALKCSKQK